MKHSDLATWCDNNSSLPGPELPDEPFVANYEIFDLDDDDKKPDSYEDGDLFRFFITTRRLIELSSKFETLLQTDGTYKLLWQGFPVLLLGSSDATRAFHTVGLAVVTQERHNDYAFLFKSIQIARNKLNLPPILESINLMADAAGAITNGFRSAGFTGVRGMCWFHVTKALKSRLAKLNDDTAALIKADIHFLQLCQTPAIFKSASNLFLQKWRDEQQNDEQVLEFLKYFEKEWLIENPNWFEGYSHPKNVAAPSTNNGNESINGLIKKGYTLREQLSLGEFHVTSFKMMSSFSKKHDPNNLLTVLKKVEIIKSFNNLY
jgi:hypothetical protein